MLSSFRFAGRQLWRQPYFAASAIAVIGLGVGINVTVLAAARAILLRPLPYASPDRLVMLWSEVKGGPFRRGTATATQVQQWRARVESSMVDVAAAELWSQSTRSQIDIAGPDGAERLRGAIATTNFFDVLGVRAARGRLFSSNDVSERTAVLSDGLWRRMFGADPQIIGRTLRLTFGRADRDERVVTVVGVLPPRFRYSYPKDTEIWLPLAWSDIERYSRNALTYQVVGRLRDGVGLESAQADMARVLESIAHDTNDSTYAVRRAVYVEPIHEYQIGDTRRARRLVWALAALIFVIASVNLTHLFVARGLTRQREAAVRRALGASRWQMLSEALREALLVSAIGGVAAIGLTSMALPLLRASLPAGTPRTQEIGAEPFDLAVAWVCATSIALVAACASLASSSHSVVDALKVGDSTATLGTATKRLRSALTAAQASLVFALLLTAALLGTSLRNLNRVELGFHGRDLMTMSMRVVDVRYLRDKASLARFQDDLLAAVRALPSIDNVTMTSALPFSGVDWSWQVASPEAIDGRGTGANLRQVDPQFFAMMGVPLRSGRLLSAADTATSVPVAVVSESLAERLFGGASPLGKHLALDKPTEIVGVVGDVRYRRIDEAPRPAFYVPRAQQPSELICVLVRPKQGVTVPSQVLRDLVKSLEPMQPVLEISTVDDIVQASIADQRFLALAQSALAVLALIVAAVGFYGVAAQGAAERTREIGLRLALGAAPGRVVRLVIAGAFRPTGLGVLGGALLSVWGAALIKGYLFDISHLDPRVYGTVAAGLLVISACASYGPARRAAAMNPSEALRHD